MPRPKFSTATDNISAQGSSKAWTELSGRNEINIPASSCLAHLVLSFSYLGQKLLSYPFYSSNPMLGAAKRALIRGDTSFISEFPA